METNLFYFNTQTLALKYFTTSYRNSVFYHVESQFNEKTFTPDDYDRINNCRYYPFKLIDNN